MNWLHSRYNISNDDMLYTLSVFVTSPDKWLGLYDWRGLTELEVSVISRCPASLLLGLLFIGRIYGLHGYFRGIFFLVLSLLHRISLVTVDYIPIRVPSSNAFFLCLLTSRHGGSSGAK